MVKNLLLISIICTLGASIVYADSEPATETKHTEIIVTATRTRQEVKDISGNVTIIKSEEIKELNVHTVNEVLKYQSGIDIQGGDFPGSSTRLEMRGLSGNYRTQRVLVMMDGRPINEEYLGDVDFRFIPVDNIERVEIVRGPASALYGSNAVGGVINLITKSGQDKPLINLKSTVGSFNTYGTILQHGTRSGGFDYFITASDQKTDGYLKNSDGTPKNWTSQNISTRADLKINDESLIRLSLGMNDGEGKEENFRSDQSKNYMDFVYQTKWSKEYQADFLARIYRNGLDQNLEWKFTPAGTYDQYTIGTQLQQSVCLIKNHLFTFGIDTKKEDVLVKESGGIINETINSSAVYIQDKIVLGEKLITTMGLRYDRHEEFSSEISPRVGVVYHFNEQTSLRSAVGKGYRAPTISDLFLPLTPYGPVTYQGNAKLKPETLWSYELGLDHKFSEDVSSGLTVYQSLLKNAWDYMRDTDNVYRPYNITIMSINGIEAEAKYQITKELGGFFNYTYNDAKYKKDENNPSIKGNYVEEIPRSQSSLGLRFQPNNNTTVINMKVKATGNRYTDPENSRKNELPKHLVTDINILTDINKNSSFFITVNNLFDRVYKDVIEYYQPGRWFETGLSIQF